MIGEKFGRLVVLELHKGRALVVCDCGTRKTVNKYYVSGGRVRSCGCLRAEMLSQRRKTHGMTDTKEYQSWCKMKSRCNSEFDISYKNYGARGIKVCRRWQNSFENFYADMGACPEGMSLERINVDGNYSPRNCKWASLYEQTHNKRNTLNISYRGETKPLSCWADALGLKYATLYRRIVVMKEPPEKAFRQCKK